jgi:hypothetical protein
MLRISIDICSLILWFRVVTVTISEFKSSQVIPPFVQLLSKLPNVHTLEVLYVTTNIPSRRFFEYYFTGWSFPSIKKAVLPAYARDILRCCPNVKEITCNRDLGGSGELVDTLARIRCSKLEVIRGFTIGPVLLKRV